MWSRRAFLGGLGTITAATAAVAQRSATDVAGDEAYWRRIRQAFTLDPALINLNNGNSSPSPRVVHDAYKRYLDSSNQLPVYYRGLIEQSNDAVHQRLADAFGCDRDEIAITRNTTEALHIAQSGLDLRAGDEVVTTDQDYPRMLWAWDQRARREGIVVKRIGFAVPATADDLVQRFERAITPRTRVLHFCHITNVTGQLFPVRELSRLARRRGILTIVDGAQAVAHFPFQLRDLECDFYGTSLHKWLMAPHGTGFLYVRREHIAKLWPLMPSHPGQANDVRKLEEIGTHPAGARAAIADAIRFHLAVGAERKAARLRYLTLRWANALKSHPRVKILSSLEAGQTWALAMVDIDGVDPQRLAQQLFDRHRIVINAMVTQGRPGPVFDFRGLRVTPNIYTTPAEIDKFVMAIEDALKNGLRS